MKRKERYNKGNFFCTIETMGKRKRIRYMGNDVGGKDRTVKGGGLSVGKTLMMK